MALHSYAFITLDEIKDYLGITGSTHDTLLTALANAATDFIEKYTQRRITTQTVSNELHSGDQSTKILVKHYPIDSEETITLEEADEPISNTDNWTTISSEKYFIDHTKGIITTNFNLTKGINNYRVSYTSGWSAANIPYDIRWAGWDLVAKMFNLRKAAGFSAQSLGDLSVTFHRQIDSDPYLRSILQKYIAAI